MVVIRLARHGRHKYPTYRIVAADKRRAATSKFLAILGTYNPQTKELTLKKEEIAEFLKNGAQASDRVLRLLKSEGVDLPKWAKTHDRNKPPKAEAKAAAEGEGAEAPAAATDEVATESAGATESKAEEVKTDVGTVKEDDNKAKAAEATEKVADAVEETVKSEKPKKQEETPKEAQKEV